MDEALKQRIEFLKETDKMKTILRQNWVIGRSRREDDAAHSWHCALMAMTLAPYAKPEVNVDRAVKMLLVHDLVEIYAGDTPCYDVDVVKTQETREKAAASKVECLLPEVQGKEYRALWEEFLACETEDAKYAVTIDHLQPLFLNYFTDGASWQTRTVSKAQVLKRNAIAKETVPELYPVIESAVEELYQKGLLS